MTVPQVVLAASFAVSARWLYRSIGPRWLAALAAALAAAVLPVATLVALALAAASVVAAAHAYRRRPAVGAPVAAGPREATAPPPKPAARRAPHPPPAYTLGVGPLRERIDVPLGVVEGHHALCVGATGWGKTWAMYTIARAHIRAGFGCVVIDMKGSPDVIERMRLEAVLAGRPFWHFSLDGGHRWNPLAHGNRSELKDKLISSQHFSEEHYKRLYEHYLLKVFELRERHGAPVDLAALVPLLTPARLEAQMRTIDDPAAADALAEYLASVGDRDRRDLRGLADRLAVLVEGVQGEYLSAAGDPVELIDLERVVRCRGVAVFSLNASRYPETAQLIGNLVLQDLNAVSGVLEGGARPTPPMLIALDEFSGLAGAHVLNLFQRSREPRWSLLLLTQEVADLRRVRPTFHEELGANVELVVGGRQNNPESAEWLSRIAGTREVWRRSFTLDRRGRPTGHGRMEAVREPIVPRDTIMSLTKGNALIVRKRPNHDAGIGAIVPARSTSDRWPAGTSREWVHARAARLRWLAHSNDDASIADSFSAPPPSAAARSPLH